MGELWVDTVNGGGWDVQEDEEERSQDIRGGPLLPMGFMTLFLGVAVSPVAAVGWGAFSAIAVLVAKVSGHQ